MLRQAPYDRALQTAIAFTALMLFMIAIVNVALLPAQKRTKPSAVGSAQTSAVTTASLAFDTQLLDSLKRPQTVVDYFLLLPASLFTYNSAPAQFDTKARQAVLGVTTGDSAKLIGLQMFAGAVEIPNKYLIVNTPDGPDGYSFSVALWTLPGTAKQPQTLIGFCKRRWEQHATTSIVQFFTFDGKRWREVTGAVFPVIPITEFFRWSQLKRYPALKPPLDIELARKEQAIIVRLDMESLKRMPELQPIAEGLERSVQTRTLELRLKNGVFAISNKY